jgi:hypothetical protein
MMLIKHIERARQLLDFTDLIKGNCNPSDLDGIYDHHDKAWVIFELKLEDKEMKLGQKLLLEHLVRDLSSTGKLTIAIVLEHKVFNTDDFIKVKDTEVRSFYISSNQHWTKPFKKFNAVEIVNTFIALYNMRKNRVGV